MKIELSQRQLEIIVDALRHHPDPEGYDFGPAYEMEREEADTLRQWLEQYVRREL